LAQHPLVETVDRQDGLRRRRAMEVAASVEAQLSAVRRQATTEPAIVFARTVQLAIREVQAVAAQFPGPMVTVWRDATLRELGGLLFAQVGAREVAVAIGPHPHDVARHGG
jgi:hypothetical protein